MINFKKQESITPDYLNLLSKNFIDRIIEVCFKRKIVENAEKIDFYTQCMAQIVLNILEQTPNNSFFDGLSDDEKQLYRCLELMFENWRNIDQDSGGYVILKEEEIHPDFKIKIQPYDVSIIKNYLSSEETVSILNALKTSDLLAYSLCLLIFSTGIAEKDLLTMKISNLTPNVLGRNNLLKGLLFTDHGGHVNDKGSSSRVYFLNPFSKTQILQSIQDFYSQSNCKPTRTLFRTSRGAINKLYLKKFFTHLSLLANREINFKTLRNTHALLLYENLPLDAIGFSLRTELIHSALIGCGVGIKDIALALPKKL